MNGIDTETARCLRTLGLACLFLCLLLSSGFAQDVSAVESAAERDDGQIVYIGDSRLEAQFEDPDDHVQTARFFGNVAAQLLGQRLVTARNFAASGFRSDQYLTDSTIELALQTPARWVVIFGVVNDIGQRGPHDFFRGDASAPMRGGIEGKLDRFLKAGMRPILVLEPGADQFATDTARTASVAAYNEAVRRYADTHPAVLVFDLPSVTLETSSPRKFRQGFAPDGIHLSNLGGAAVGRAFADLLQPLLAQVPFPANGRPEADNLIGRSSAQMPGSAQANVTGTVPDGWFAMCTAGTSAVVSTQTTGDETHMRLDMKAEAAGDCTLGRDMTGEEPGQRYEQLVDVRVELGATGFAGPYLQLQANRDGRVADVIDNFASVAGPGPSEARDLVLRTPPLTVPNGRHTWFTTRLGARFTGPGSAVISFSRPFVGKFAAR